MQKMCSFITSNFHKYNPSSLDSYLSIGGFEATQKAICFGSDKVIEEMGKAQIRGRGGAEYDLAKKWTQARLVSGPIKYVVCNADEGEPCTFKDRDILSYDPFRLIEGMIICGLTINATAGYIYIREEYTYLQSLFLDAIKQCRRKNFLGKNILGTSNDFELYVYTGAGAYVCGEGSTLIESIEGKSGRPRIKPPYIKECGLWQKPTCVNNVETLTLAAAIMQYGVNEYIKYGTEKSVGTKIISLAGNINNPGTYEIPFGLTLEEIINDLGGGITNGGELQFIQLGGASGKIAPASVISTPYTYEDLKNQDLTIGSGGFLVVDTNCRIIDFIKSIQDFFVHESCGKCTPCREGNRQIEKILERFIKNEQREHDLDTAIRFAEIMKNCSFCGLGETAQSAFLSAVKHFPNEFLSGEEVSYATN